MSDPSETGGRPLASSIPLPEGTTPSTTAHRRRRRPSHSSDEPFGATKSTSSSRRRPNTRNEASLGPHAGSSRGDSSTMQRSISPTHMSPDNSVHYTRTGRISKAKKGLKVHNCECGRSYTRAEHLRRHQKNHAQDALRCEFPGCGKPFYRLDLLQRHQERHNEPGKESPQVGYSPGSTAESEAHVTASVAVPASIVTTHPQAPTYYAQSISPMPESATEARYTSNPFRTPRIPSSSFGSVIRSSPNSKSPSTFNHLKQRQSYSARQTSVTIPVPADGLPSTNMGWNNDPFGQSSYSPSSGYASPIPGTGDYANMFANPPYGPGSNRTRTSSNASFIEPWTYPSRSPTSATSTMAYTWTSNDKSPAPSSLAYMATSYPMTSMPMAAGVDPISGFGHFGPKTMAQRDEEEQAFLFPEQSYGMGHIAHTYPFEHYLDNFWRLFHPTFPVVHRATSESMSQSPMLHAAMFAIGGQYSTDASVKRKSRILHDRCIKLLDKRVLDVMTEDERLCDWQAAFLIEVLSQYRARRAAKTLSSRFENMYHKFCEDFRIVNSGIADTIAAISQPENATYEQWAQWVELSSRQRLLLCCYILESQQATLLARIPQQSLIQLSGFDLPFPAHSTLWDATSPSNWALAARQYAHEPTYVYQINHDMVGMSFDSFQSSLLIAAHYNHFNNPAPYLSPPAFPAIDHLFNDSPITKHQLLTAKLLQLIPLRALLAVAGESWILSEKVPSAQAFSGYKTTLKTWINSLWASTTEPDAPVKSALKFAIDILQHATTTPTHTLRLELGADMGLYFAALVIWAVTVAANTRINATQTQVQSHRYQSHSPLPNAFHSTPNHLSAGTHTPSTPPNPSHSSALGLAPPQSARSPAPPPSPRQSMTYSEIMMLSINFLSNAALDLDFLGIVPQWPRDVAQWQQGCGALMRWVKMRLRNGSVETVGATNLTPTSAGKGVGGEGFGELVDGVIGVLEKIMGRGWEGWGV